MTEMARSGAGEEAKKFVKQQEQKRRVKLYVLNEQRAWDDKGTGHVICAPFDAAGGLGLTVRSEVDNTVLLESKIQLDTAYQKQQETLIVWSEADNCDLALSFQEKLGCDEIWEKICQDDDNFLQDLFSQLSATATPVNRRRELTLFLKEFAGFAQTLQPHARDGFFKSMSSYGALPAIQRSLSCGDEATKVASAAIFAMVVDYSPPMVREYMLMQAGETPPLSDEDLLMNILIKQLFSDEDPELSSAMQLLNILRILVDPENMMANAAQAKSEKLEFLSFFYKRCMSHLCGPLLECTDKQNDFKKFDDYHTANKMSLILEVLSFCMEHHTYNIRNFVISRDVLKRVLVLLQSKHAFLALGALRLFRRVVQLKEEFYYRHIVKQRLFDAIVKCWRDNGHRYNMKNSAMLELFEYIKTEDLKTLIACFIENYYEEFKDVDYVKTFSQLKLRYEQQQDRLNRLSGSPMVGGRKEGPPTPPLSSLKRGPRETDPDEEEWFAEDDEEWEDELPTSPDYPSVSVRTDRLPTSSGGPKTPPPPGVDGNNDGGRHSPPTSADLKGMPALQRMSSMTSNTDDFPSMMKHRNVVEADSVFSPGGTRPQFLSRLGAAGTRHPNPKISISIKSPLSVNSEVATETTNQQKPSSLADHSEASTSSAIISDYFEDFGRGLLGRFTGREDLLPGGFTGRIIREDFGRKRARESSSGGRVDQVSSSKSARAKDESAPASVVLTGIRQGSLVDYGYDSDSEEDDEWEEGEGTNLGSNQQQRGQNSSEEKKESPTPGISS